MKRPRLVDVARESRTSPATVSRILNGDSTFSTTEQTRQHVFEAARKLGYLPDLRAQNLRRAGTNIIGVFEYVHVSRTMLNQWMLEGVEERVRESGLETIYRLDVRDTSLRSVIPWRFDGGILMQRPSTHVMDGLEQAGIPYVTINDLAEGSVGHAIPDEKLGVAIGLDHLRELGHRKIAFVGRAMFLGHFSYPYRRDAFMQSMRENGQEPLTAELDDGEPMFLQTLIDRGVTAILAYNIMVAVPVLRAATLLGISVPGDISLVAFDNVFPAEEIHPSITTICLNAHELGRRGAGILFDHLDGRSKSRIEELIPYTLTARESTAPLEG